VLQPLWPDARAVIALAALVAVPGLAVVRAPWRAVPLLSVAFWTLSWPWFVGSSRERWLQAALATFAALAALRLLRPRLPPPPRPEHALVAAAAATLLAPFAAWAVGPGSRMPAESLAALLLSWRDGWPASFEPLLDAGPFRASGLAGLAADVSLLSGAPAHRTTLLVALAGHAALLLALWWLAETALAPLPAALLALALTWAAAAPPGTGPGALAAACAAQALAVWRDRSGVPSAFAAGACAAAAVAVHPSTGMGALAIAAVWSRTVPEATARDETAAARRKKVAAGSALVLLIPLALRLRHLDAPELGPLVALAGVLAAVHGRRRGWLRRSLPRTWASVLIAIAAVRGIATTARTPSSLDAGQVAALEWVHTHARLLDAVCAPEHPDAAWIPAIAGRAVHVRRAADPRSHRGCAVTIAFSGRAPAPAVARGAVVFESGSSVVWTNDGNR
jgi:hypothetical protein